MQLPALGNIVEQKSVIIMVHGIRDFALWQDEIRSALENDFYVESTNYGRFDLLRFLCPIDYFRNSATDKVYRQIRDIEKQHPGKSISLIAHSFGTFIVARILKSEFDFKAHRVIFCGSVVNYDFPFEEFSDRFQSPILNEVGNRDVWPAVAESVTWGYGSAGSFGFKRPRVRDRWHKDAGHGFFLNKEFCHNYWLPFLSDGTIVPGERAANPPWWLTLIYIVRLKYVIISLLLASLLLIYMPSLSNCYPYEPPRDKQNTDRPSRSCAPGRLSYLKWIDEAEYPAVNPASGRWLNDRANRSLALVGVDEQGTLSWTEQNLFRVDAGRPYWQPPGEPGWTEIVGASADIIKGKTGLLLRRQDPNQKCDTVSNRRKLLEAFVPLDVDESLSQGIQVKMCYRWSYFSCENDRPLYINEDPAPFGICVGPIVAAKKDMNMSIMKHIFENK